MIHLYNVYIVLRIANRGQLYFSHMIAKIERINKILSRANRCYYISVDLKSEDFKYLVRQNEFFRFSGHIYLIICIIELAKLFQKKKTEKQNIFSFLNNLNANQHGISADDIKNWKIKLSSADQQIIRKVGKLRNKLLAHLDDDWIETLRNNPLPANEIKHLLDIAITVVGEINDKFGLAPLEYLGSQPERACAQEHLRRYQGLLEIEKKYSS